MSRILSPDNYVKPAAVLLNDCSDAAQWSQSGTILPFADSNNHNTIGNASQYLFIADGSATGLRVNSLTGMAWDLSKVNQITFKLGWDILAADRQLGNSFQILLGSNAGSQFADYILSKAIFGGSKPLDELYSFDLTSAADFPSSAGAFDSSNIQWCSIRINNTDTVGDKKFYLDAIYSGLRSSTNLLLTFDDADATVFDTAFPIMQDRGLVSTLYINGSTIGDAGKMTISQLRTMEAAGHQIANHSYTHVGWNGQTKAYMTADFLANKSWLEDNGFNGSEYFAYVGGQFNDDALAVMTEQNVVTARTVEDTLDATYQNGNFGTSLGLLNPLMMRTDNLGVGSTETAAAALAYIDNAIRYGYGVGIYGHKIVTTPTLSTEFSTAEFTALCDGVLERKNRGLLENATIRSYTEYL